MLSLKMLLGVVKVGHVRLALAAHVDVLFDQRPSRVSAGRKRQHLHERFGHLGQRDLVLGVVGGMLVDDVQVDLLLSEERLPLGLTVRAGEERHVVVVLLQVLHDSS